MLKMEQNLAKNAQSVQEVLKNKGLKCAVMELSSSTRSAVEAANAIGCDVKQIVKSLIFKTQETAKPVLILASGANRVNESLIKDCLNEKIVKADADYTRELTGFAIGGIPPVGHRPSNIYLSIKIFFNLTMCGRQPALLMLYLILKSKT